MVAQCFLLDRVGTNYRLYVSSMSTVEALSLLNPANIVFVQHLYAERIGRPMLESDVPKMCDIPNFCTFIGDDSLNIVDCMVLVGDCTIKTHDDGEATFLVANQDRAIEFVQRLTRLENTEKVVAALSANLGAYVAIENDIVKIYRTFHEYLERQS